MSSSPTIVMRNIALLCISYFCVFCTTTMAIGAGPLVLKSVGGSSSIAPLIIAGFFGGSSFVSLFTPRIFRSLGRRRGFMIGNAFGLFSAALGSIAIIISSPVLVILSALPMGMFNGIGFHTRFAAMECVEQDRKPLVSTLVLSGGCIAGFIGPEGASWTRFLVNQYEYWGLFILVAVYNVCMFTAVCFTSFEETEIDTYMENVDAVDDEVSDIKEVVVERTRKPIYDVIQTRDFQYSCFLGTFAWSIMVLPMSVVRVALMDLGFTNREGLLTLQLHFFSMFSPGFFTGKLVAKLGPRTVASIAALFFVGSMVSAFLATENSIAPYMVALILVGIAWNLSFTSGTVNLGKSYHSEPNDAIRIQSANDCIMFAFAGSFIVSAGFMYEVGGSNVDGWQTVNMVTSCLVGILVIVQLVGHLNHQQRKKQLN